MVRFNGKKLVLFVALLAMGNLFNGRTNVARTVSETLLKPPFVGDTERAPISRTLSSVHSNLTDNYTQAIPQKTPSELALQATVVSLTEKVTQQQEEIVRLQSSLVSQQQEEITRLQTALKGTAQKAVQTGTTVVTKQESLVAVKSADKLPPVSPSSKPLPINVSLVNDRTLHWDPTVNRLFHPNTNTSQNLPFLILLTTYGWNQLDQKKGLEFSRGMVQTEWANGIINHPNFHPTAWDDIEYNHAKIDPNMRYYVFLDKSNCYDANWPTYGGHDPKNSDTRFGRSMNAHRDCGTGMCHLKKQLARTRLFQSSPNAYFVNFDCRGHGGPAPAQEQEYPKRPHPNFVYASFSAHQRFANASLDQGLPSLPVSPMALTSVQKEAIQTCDAETNRTFLLTYIGNYRAGRCGLDCKFNPRGGLAQFHDNNRTFILRYFRDEFKQSAIANWSYPAILQNSLYSAAPRGDNKFSYRFAEVMASGAIPVVMSDDWLWPFRPELVEWEECAIMLPENGYNNVMKVLNNITEEQRCHRRQKCFQIYQQYMANATRIIQGVVEGLELAVNPSVQPKPLFGYPCIEGVHNPKNDCNFV